MDDYTDEQVKDMLLLLPPAKTDQQLMFDAFVDAATLLAKHYAFEPAATVA